MTYKYKIKYNMKGGYDHYKSEFPDYPDNLNIIRTNDWPPKKSSLIEIEDETNGILKGLVIDNIWNDTASIVKLENPNYVEASFIDYPQYNNGKGHYLLLGNHMWNYTNEKSNNANVEDFVNKINLVETSKNINNLASLRNDNIPDFIKVSDFILNENLSLDDKIKLFKNAEQNDKVSSNKINLVETSNNVASLKNENCQDFIKVSELKINENLSLDDKIKLFKNAEQHDKVLSNKIDSIMPNDHIDITKNPFYSPLLSNLKKDYFSEKEIDIVLSNTGESFSSLSSDKIELLNRKLKSFEKIEDKDVKLIINKNIAINNLIDIPDDEINEGNKIQRWIEKVLMPIFDDLKIKIHSGYVYITRKGVNIADKITKELVPSLNYFNWQENKPIDYHTLKYVIFQNSFQKNIESNIVQKREAEDILSQEYVIALQPEPYYLLWTLKRLIMVWYGDTVFESQIRKIKVLINQFRADPTKDYNKKNGILPQILIYPKYGTNSARIVISKLEYYFSLYIDENANIGYKDIQWRDSKPTYFIKKNSLIYFSNGSIDLKNYIEASFNANSVFINDIFTKDYSELIESRKIMSV